MTKGLGSRGGVPLWWPEAPAHQAPGSSCYSPEMVVGTPKPDQFRACFKHRELPGPSVPYVTFVLRW